MQFIDDAEFQVAIDLDAGGRIASLKWKELEFTIPFRGGVANYGWYAMAPWAGRIKDGIIKSPSGESFQLPTQLDPPNALHGFGLTSSPGSYSKIQAETMDLLRKGQMGTTAGKCCH